MEAHDHFFGPAPWQVAIYSKKAGGKTTLIKYAVHEYRDVFAYVVVISATADANQAFDWLPKKFVHTTYNPEIIKKLMAKQAKIFKTHGTQCLLVLDDVLGMEGLDWKKSTDNPLNALFTQNRHYGISLIVASQGVRQLPKLLRLNVDRCCFLRNLQQAQDDLWQEYGHMSRKEFVAWLTKNTADYQAIIYNASVADPAKAYSFFKVPAAFLSLKFRLVYLMFFTCSPHEAPR